MKDDVRYDFLRHEYEIYCSQESEIVYFGSKYQRCRSVCCLHLQGRRFVFCSAHTREEYSPSRKMEATCPSEALMGALLLDYNVLHSSRLIFNQNNAWYLSVKWKYL